MKILIFLIIIMLPLISAFQITEIELNPMGPDSSHEWIELYSEEEINLTNYKIVNNDGGEINLNGSFEGYLIYEFPKQWLDNSDEKIYLYNKNELIQSTSVMEDTLDSSFTFQFCDSWNFLEETKGEKNICEEEIKEELKEVIEEKETKEEEIKEEIEISPEKKEVFEQKEPSKIVQETIELNPKTIKTNENSKESKNKYPKYSIVLFCILLLFLLLKKPKKKNEFR